MCLDSEGFQQSKRQNIQNDDRHTIATSIWNKKIKDNIIFRLGTIGQLSTSRDLNAAWNETKKKAAKLYPDKFILDGRNVLHWNDGKVKILDKKISGVNFKKLNEIAEMEGCNVNALVTKMITMYKKQKK